MVKKPSAGDHHHDHEDHGSISSSIVDNHHHHDEMMVINNMISSCSSSSISNDEIVVNKSEIVKLTKEAKSWEFTCSFCFKRFPSAQALGGHQNAHRGERLEEKRLFVRDPISYRKRAYLRAIKATTTTSIDILQGNNPISSTSTTHGHMHAPHHHNYSNIINNNGSSSSSSSLPRKLDQDHVLSLPVDFSCENAKKWPINVVMNFLPPKELSLVESVGIVRMQNAAKDNADASDKACINNGFDIDAAAAASTSLETLDLTLKL